MVQVLQFSETVFVLVSFFVGLPWPLHYLHVLYREFELSDHCAITATLLSVDTIYNLRSFNNL